MTQNDTMILNIVSDTIDTIDDWAAELDSRLLDADVDLADDQPDGSDPWEIVRLADGRSVWLTREDRKGPDRFTITE